MKKKIKIIFIIIAVIIVIAMLVVFMAKQIAKENGKKAIGTPEITMNHIRSIIDRK